MQETSEGIELFDWRAALRGRRLSMGLSQKELSARSGLSLAAVKAYESGRRLPSRASLTALVDALGTPREEANRIHGGAGYAIDWGTLLDGRYVFDLAEAAGQLEAMQWPAFITNQACDIVAANSAFVRLMDVGELPEAVDRNLFAGNAMDQFARCVDNYDELITFMMGLAKGDPRRPQNLRNPAPWLQAPIARALANDAALAARYRELWERAEPLPHKTTHQYRVRWTYRSRHHLHFVGLLTVADVWSELSRNDWIPADAATWQTLDAVVHAHRTPDR